MDEDFYAPREIHFTPEQYLWLIRTLPTLRAGYWPTEESNYIDIPIGKRTGKSGAYFETPVQAAVEVEDRLEKCGIDGLILEAIECWGKSEESLAKYFRIPIWSIRTRKSNALNYGASGSDRRWHDTKKRGKILYQEWVEGKRWNREAKTYYWK